MSDVYEGRKKGEDGRNPAPKYPGAVARELAITELRF